MKMCKGSKLDCYFNASVDCNKCEHYINVEENKMPEQYQSDFINFGIDPNRCTCLKCDRETNSCQYKFDPYNTDGDCLMEK